MPKIDTPWIAIPAHIRAVVDQAQAAAQAQASGQAPAGDLFIFEAEISNDGIDTYFTHMGQSTLQNFANGARRGVALLDSHDGSKLPIGYSMGGEYRQDGDRAYVVATFYTKRGIRFGGQHSYATTDDLIAAIEAGLVRDMSVGFYGGQHICDLCGLDYYGLWNNPGAEEYCPHIAGMTYDMPTGEPGLKRETLATVTIEGASLSEVSTVYDGATPGAMITKAAQLSRHGDLDAQTVAAIEMRYRVNLPHAENGDPKMKNTRTQDAAAQAPAAEAVPDVAEAPDAAAQVAQPDEAPEAMAPAADAPEAAEAQPDGQPDEAPEAPEAAEGGEDERQAAKVVAQAQQALARVQGLAGDDLITRVQALVEMTQELAKGLATERQAHAAAQAQVVELQPLAEAGRAYRDDLIERTIQNGIAAQGANFPEATYRALLAGSDLETIKAIQSQFEALAHDRLPVGRQTNAAAQAPAPAGNHVDRVPDLAFVA